MAWWTAALLCIVGTACNYNVTSPSSASSTSTASVSGGGTTSASTTLTYVKDVQPILASDCVTCHGPSRADAGVNLSTYANVMRVVAAGNPNSLLVIVTKPGGLMYGEFRGSASQKSQAIYDWVVNSNAMQQ